MKYAISIIAAVFPFLLSANAYSAQADDLARVETAPSGITYATGGVGKQSVDKMQELERGRDFNVKMTFAWNEGNFLASVPVTIEDAAGKKVLDVQASGPILLVDLPQGRYTLAASYQGKLEKRAVNVAQGQKQTVHFSWQRPRG